LSQPTLMTSSTPDQARLDSQSHPTSNNNNNTTKQQQPIRSPAPLPGVGMRTLRGRVGGRAEELIASVPGLVLLRGKSAPDHPGALPSQTASALARPALFYRALRVRLRDWSTSQQQRVDRWLAFWHAQASKRSSNSGWPQWPTYLWALRYPQLSIHPRAV
jgi:hypothetical protein